MCSKDFPLKIILNRQLQTKHGVIAGSRRKLFRRTVKPKTRPKSNSEKSNAPMKSKHLRSYMNHVYGEKIYVCNVCKKQDPSKILIKAHIKGTHPDPGTSDLSKPKKAASNKKITAEIRKFLIDQKGGDMFVCGFCNNESQKSVSIEIHIESHLNFIHHCTALHCTLCEVTKKTRHGINLHKNRAHFDK